MASSPPIVQSTPMKLAALLSLTDNWLKAKDNSKLDGRGTFGT